jgi:GPH family glycoside/pentoside/hexuronide:cation symporter
MSDQIFQEKPKISFGLKIAFGLGMLANQMFPAALGIFMVVLVQGLGFPAWMWGILFFLPRLFDSILDPIMGFISDNTLSVWGRRRQYVFIGAIILGISFVLMWQLYSSNSIVYNFVYFLLWSFVFYTGLTIFSIPYVAMGYEMSDDYHERTSIMAVSQWLGQWAWVIAPWFWVVMYDKSWFSDPASATRTLAFWVGIFCMVLAMVPAIFIKAKSTKANESLVPLTVQNIGKGMKEILLTFKEAFKIPQFRKICFATFFIFNAFNTVASFSFFIVVYYLYNGDADAAGLWPTLFGSIGALVTTFVVIPIVARMSKKLGKKRAFMISQGISLVGYLLFWFLFVPGKPYMFIFALPLFSFGIGGLFTIMMSMTADVCDLDELNSYKRREGIFGAIYWWMVKFGFAIAGLLSGLIMSLVHFTPDAPTQPEGAVTGLRLFFSGVPMLGTLVAMWLMRNYDISEDKANEIRQQLEKRKLPKPALGYMSGALGDRLKTLSIPPYSGTDFQNKSESELSALVQGQLYNGVHGICFSPYAEGQDTNDILIESEVRQRVNIISAYTKWIRTFSCTHGHEKILVAAREKGLKTLAGAWISSDKERNEKEIEALIQLAKDGLVDIAAVGNEVLLRNELSPQEIIRYIRRVRQQVQTVQVGFADTYFHIIQHPELIEACDVVMINCYPFWEGTGMVSALDHLRKMYQITQQCASGKKIIITETGWPSMGDKVNEAEPTVNHAIKYFLQVQEWAQRAQIDLFYFSSFDETWKTREEGTVGSRWGIWDKDGKLKY